MFTVPVPRSSNIDPKIDGSGLRTRFYTPVKVTGCRSWYT